MTRAKERLLALPGGFDFWQCLVGAPRSKRRFVEEHVRANPGERVLDLGCGTGALLRYLPNGTRYVGVDLNPSYIETAHRRFAGLGEFVCADVTYFRPVSHFDVVIGYGILHHLDDHGSDQTLASARAALASGGRALFAEPCRLPKQGVLERRLMNADRGRYIRTVDHYVKLMGAHFSHVTTKFAPGRYRIPYTFVVLEARS